MYMYGCHTLHLGPQVHGDYDTYLGCKWLRGEPPISFVNPRERPDVMLLLHGHSAQLLASLPYLSKDCVCIALYLHRVN